MLFDLGSIKITACRKEIIRVSRTLLREAESVIIGTDFDREEKLIGSDALARVLSVNLIWHFGALLRLY